MAVVPLLALLACFLLGSIPTGVIVARSKGIDLRKIGSGNIGATNVGRALGKKWAFIVLLVDAGKGVLPVVLLGRWFESPWLPALGALAAVLGHSFSIFLRGRGGKGVATSLGAGMALAPLPSLVCLGAFLVVLAVFRIVSVASLTATACYPVFLWLFGVATWPRLTFAFAILVLVLARHKDNLRRLRRGEEHRV
jgi:acyl phosphate:glycerol-3-phosphate acyltransferase